MAGARFDILFSGELIGDADPDSVRRNLQQRFKLTEEAAEQLFSGRTVAVKLDVDTETAARYRKIFRDAKALVEIRPVDSPPETLPEPAPEPRMEPAAAPLAKAPERVTAAEPVEARREPADRRNDPRGDRDVFKFPRIDISYLSLVPGWDWTLEDCQPPFKPVSLPDTSHLEIVALAPDAGEDDGD